MFSKLAIGNVKKSIKDYAIYFFTLVFGVCLFYVFNSMDSQESMLVLTKNGVDIIEMLTSVMGYLSYFISIILGFLILYANRFLIRRRKKELGLYMVLGMDKGKISRMLVFETLLIGVFALVVGLLIGVFASQGLAVLTANLMETKISHFQFAFSSAAAIKSVLYFGIIFVIVIIFNTFSISKYKLIDLLTAGRKNEKNRTPNIKLSVVLFLVSLVLLGFSYKFLFDLVEQIDLKALVKIIIVGSVGTFLFFYSLSGFALRVIMASKKIYLRGLNMFILRQINSKLSTTFVSMTIICLMLLIAITTLSVGLGFSNVMNANGEKGLPCDMTVVFHNKNTNVTTEEVLKKKGVDTSGFKETNEVVAYNRKDFLYKEIFKDVKSLNGFDMTQMNKFPVEFITVSEYNKQRRFDKKTDELSLSEGEYSIIITMGKLRDVLNDKMKENMEIHFSGRTLKPKGNVIEYSINDEMIGSTLGMIVLPDSCIQDGKSEREVSYLNINYKKPSEEYDASMIKKIESAFKKSKQDDVMEYQMYVTRTETQTQKVGIKVVASFFILYVGIVFLISCAAVLALQQLSESSDNVSRYQLLRKLGVEESMMKRSLFVQMGISFLVPLVVAMIHSTMSIRFSSQLFELLGETGVTSNILVIAGFVIVIYGGYFVATYLGGKSIIREKN